MITKRSVWFAIVATALFGAGWWSARSSNPARTESAQNNRDSIERGHVITNDRGDRINPAANSRIPLPHELIVALQGDIPARTPALLAALEKNSDAELTSEMLAAMDKILQAGDTEECQYLLSLLEQREELTSVHYLIKQLDHPNEEIRTRSLMACEAIAGQVFSSSAQAKTWSLSWEPDPERQRLFTRQTHDENTSSPPRPGQRSRNTKTDSDKAQQQ